MSEHPPIAAVPPLPASQPNTWREWRGSGRVLVVEDDPAVRVLVARTLPRLGFTASTAANGTEALNIIRALPDDYVLILMDFRLPGMPTDALIREIRLLRPEIAIIMMTGLTRETVLQKLGDIPINGFVHKPFTLDLLASQIRGALAP
jgi:two-component system cell cycle sensor histidine kinase/response regulator CckA